MLGNGIGIRGIGMEYAFADTSSWGSNSKQIYLEAGLLRKGERGRGYSVSVFNDACCSAHSVR